MNGTSTDELIRAIYYFFLLGLCFRICCFVIFKSLSISASVLHSIRTRKSFSEIKYFELYDFLNKYRISQVFTNIVMFFLILIVGILYAIFNYAIIDGILRLIPFVSFVIGLVLFECVFKKAMNVINKYLNKLLAAIILLPISKIIGIISGIMMKIEKKHAFISNKAKRIYIDNKTKK